MAEKNGLFHTLSNSCKDDWWESFIWLLYLAAGSLAPVYISILILAIRKQPIHMIYFTGHAEFSIYSAALLASSGYLILRDLKKPFPHRHIFGLLVGGGITTSIALFASVTVFSKVGIEQIDENVVKNISIFLFLISLIIAYLANVLDSAISRLDIPKIYSEDGRNLKVAFDALEEIK